MIDGSVLQSGQRCFEKRSRVVVKMVVSWPLQIQNLQQLTTACCEKAALNIGQWPRESLVMKKL